MAKSVFTDQYDRFRQSMIAARKAAGLTQVDVANLLDRPQSYVSKYERGERRLDVVEFIQVAKAIGIDPKGVIRQLETDFK